MNWKQVYFGKEILEGSPTFFFKDSCTVC